MTTKIVVMAEAKAMVASMAQADVARIYKHVVGAKPPRGTKIETLKDALIDALKEQATGEGDAAVLNETAEGWLAEGDGKKAEPKPAAPKAPAEKPLKLKKASKPARAPKPRDERLPAVGETITKHWRDRDLAVKCLAEGFEFEGKTYGSLSKIASELQGCPSNGFLFFALTAAAKAAAARHAEREAAKQTEATTQPEATAAPKPEKPAKKAKAGKGKGTKKSKGKGK